MKHIKNLTIITALTIGVTASAQTYVSSPAYKWVGDSIVQGKYKAYAVSDKEIVSNYEAQPHYFMPIDNKWELKNNIADYPILITTNKLHRAIFNMALDEMINAVEADTTLRTGKEWAGVWTRDVSYSIILSMAYLQPEASKISLMKKVNSRGMIIQDTGSGGAWPISTDRMIWTLAAYEIYKVTGDQKWLEYIYPIIKNSFDVDYKTIFDPETGLVHGETSFIDWREQSYPKWMQTADIYQSEAMGTNVIHAAGLKVLSQIASLLGHNKESNIYNDRAEKMKEAVNNIFWLDNKGYYAMYLYGRDYPILNKRAETLGESLAILYDIASDDQAVAITKNNPVTPYGPAVFFPQIPDVPSYHNNALWPFVASYWTLANAKAHNEEGTLLGLGAVFRAAALFTTNKENLNLDNGDIATELNSSNMLWSLSGNLAITCRVLFGINFETDGIRFEPFVPKAFSDSRTLSNLSYRGAKLNITVEGHGDKIKYVMLNGKIVDPYIPAKNLKGNCTIRIIMTDNDIARMSINDTPNIKTPTTPITRANDRIMSWTPIEYIKNYIVLKNGREIAHTQLTTWKMDPDGEYQVIGVNQNGIESFASEPLNNSKKIIVDIPSDLTTLTSSEVSYRPDVKIEGFEGNGFVEIDHYSQPVTVPVRITKPGRYGVVFIYANGNGPVNTENKCAVRTLVVNNQSVGTIVMPTRGAGRWNDWGTTNSLAVDLPAGNIMFSLIFEPWNENMNLATNHAIIDRIVITPLSK